MDSEAFELFAGIRAELFEIKNRLTCIAKGTHFWEAVEDESLRAFAGGKQLLRCQRCGKIEREAAIPTLAERGTLK